MSLSYVLGSFIHICYALSCSNFPPHFMRLCDHSAVCWILKWTNKLGTRPWCREPMGSHEKKSGPVYSCQMTFRHWITNIWSYCHRVLKGFCILSGRNFSCPSLTKRHMVIESWKVSVLILAGIFFLSLFGRESFCHTVIESWKDYVFSLAWMFFLYLFGRASFRHGRVFFSIPFSERHCVIRSWNLETT